MNCKQRLILEELFVVSFTTYYLGSAANIRSSVGVATGYELDGWGSIRGRGKSFFFTPQRPDRFWGPASYPMVLGALSPG
jgi:hypothetical protein